MPRTTRKAAAKKEKPSEPAAEAPAPPVPASVPVPPTPAPAEPAPAPAAEALPAEIKEKRATRSKGGLFRRNWGIFFFFLIFHSIVRAPVAGHHKRKMNVFQQYQAAHLEQLRKDNPMLKPKEVLELLRKNWASTSENPKNKPAEVKKAEAQ